MPSDRVDVIVTDGFTGNVALKTGEGTARMIQGLLREAFAYSAAVADRRPLRADLAQAPAEAHRPAPGQRRGLPRAERHGHQVARLAPTPPASRRRSSSPSPSPSTASPSGSRPESRSARRRTRPTPRAEDCPHEPCFAPSPLGCGHYLPGARRRERRVRRDARHLRRVDPHPHRHRAAPLRRRRRDDLRPRDRRRPRRARRQRA